MLATIAQATLPAYQPGDRLADREIKEIARDVEVLAQAGARQDTLPGIVAHYQRRYGPNWRDPFWRQQVRTANLRYQHPELYGPSPCDPPRATDVDQHGEAATGNVACPDRG